MASRSTNERRLPRGRSTAGGTRSLEASILAEILRRVIDAAAPEKIILFGSAARGDMDQNSDVDLLVVKAGEYNKRRLTGDIYEALYGVPEAVDVIVVTPEQVDHHRNSWMLVIHHALREGKVVYAAA